MKSSQRTVQYLFCGKTIVSKIKYVMMNLWDYHEWEAKKYRHGVNYALKITNATGKWFQQWLKYITVLLQTIICLHSHPIIDKESLLKEKIFVNDDDAFVCAQHLTGFNHQLVSLLTSKLYG